MATTKKYNPGGLILFTLAVLVPVLFYDNSPNVWAPNVFAAAVAAWLFRTGSPLAAEALFFPVLTLTFFIVRVPSMWVVNITLAVGAYLVLINAVPSLRSSRGWLRAGRADAATVIIMVATVVVSAGCLAGWRWLFDPDLGHYDETIPGVGPVLLVAGIAAFSLFNALAEEFVFRGIVWQGLSKAAASTVFVVFAQAVLFGLSHFRGFPSGAVGVGLATVYGLVLGVIRLRSGGLAAPVATHVFADLVISLLVLDAIGRI